MFIEVISARGITSTADWSRVNVGTGSEHSFRKNMAVHRLSVGPRQHKMCARTLFVVVVVLCETLGASAQPCPTGHYMAPGDSPGGQCKPCSSCPLNQIIRKPCTAYRDNVCGPFYEFEFFNQGHHDPRSMPPSFAIAPTKASGAPADRPQEARAGLVSSADSDGKFIIKLLSQSCCNCHLENE